MTHRIGGDRESSCHFNLHFGRIWHYRITQISVQNRNHTIIWSLVLPFFFFPISSIYFSQNLPECLIHSGRVTTMFLNAHSTSKAAGWTFLLLNSYVQTVQVEEMRLIAIWPLGEVVCSLLCRLVIRWPWVSAWHESASRLFIWAQGYFFNLLLL